MLPLDLTLSFPVVLSFAAAYFSLMMAIAVLLNARGMRINYVFAIGIALLAGEEIARGFSVGAVLPGTVIYWQKRAVAISALAPAVWLIFSLGYARVDAGAILRAWKWGIAAAFIIPASLITVFRASLFEGSIALTDTSRWTILLGQTGLLVNASILVTSVLILYNLERTVRSSVGRMRWQIKFIILGVVGLFAFRIYLSSQSLLYSTLDTGFSSTAAFGLLAANALFGVALIRGSSRNVDVYLSTTTIHNSFTVVLVGIYLVAVGLLARLARYSIGDRSLPVDAFVIFVALTGLAILLLSDRLRRKLRLFVSRHFVRSVYDYRKVWMELTKRTTSMLDVHELGTAVSRTISDSLDVLSVSVWLVDDSQRRLSLGGSTAFSRQHVKMLEQAGTGAAELIEFLEQRRGCHDLSEFPDLEWPQQIEKAAGEMFHGGRFRYIVGLQAGETLVGAITLNDDRVGGDPELSPEDIVLLETLASQLAASLLNLKLSTRLQQAKELEAFQSVSTFFVHDLKNVASRLSLTMQNLPQNFDNPEFRADALGVISNSLSRIDEMCGRLGVIRQEVELKLDSCDLNQIVDETINAFGPNLTTVLDRDLAQVPLVTADSEQLQKVLTNLLLNASEAVNGSGRIRVATVDEGDAAGFLVVDNGCGMSEDFIETRLFRPFQTTKKKGLGIGLFHSKQIIEAHHGSIDVSSVPGAGTEFRVLIPKS